MTGERLYPDELQRPERLVKDAVRIPVLLKGERGQTVQTSVSFREHINPIISLRKKLRHGVIFFVGFACNTTVIDGEINDYCIPIAQKIYEQSRDTVCVTFNQQGGDRHIENGVLHISRDELETCTMLNEVDAVEQSLPVYLQHHLPDSIEKVTLYGHSKGAVSGSRADLGKVQRTLVEQGRDIDINLILSAPAFKLNWHTVATGPLITMLRTGDRLMYRLPYSEAFAQRSTEAIINFFLKNVGHFYGLDYDDPFIKTISSTHHDVIARQTWDLLRQKYSDMQMREYLGKAKYILLGEKDRLVDNLYIRRFEKDIPGKITTFHSGHILERDEAIIKDLAGYILEE